MTLLKRSCSLCDHGLGNVLHKQQFALPAEHCLPDTYEVVYCNKCDFVFANHGVSQAHYTRYYRNQAGFANPSAPPCDRELFDAKAQAELIAEYLPNKRVSILQVNARQGLVLQFLQEMGYLNLIAMDPSEANVHWLHTKKLKAFQNDLLFSIPLIHRYANSFDFVICLDSLQKVVNVKLALSNLLKLCKARGRLYIETPDASYYKDNLVHPFSQFTVENINHFDARFLVETLRKDTRASVLLSAQREQRIDKVRSEYKTALALQLLGPRNDYYRSKNNEYQATLPNIQAYVAASKHCLNQAFIGAGFQKMKELVSTQEPILIWGAGNTTARMLATTILGHCNIEAFLDSDISKHNQVLRGREIKPPFYLRHTTCKRLIVCSVYFSEQILQQFLALELTGISVIVFK